ncbi:MAG: molybdenum cofactor guanylyltransferase [Methanosarcinaceae archaeon]|nr:molybdenum cofactor guanylyltransferase [Methanosarcinaceae archaeon]
MIRSSLILAGGRARRLENKEKALIPFRGKTVIEHTIDVLEELSDEIIVSIRDDKQKHVLTDFVGNLTMVVDRYSDVGPLAGMLEGFKSASGEYVFVTACDMPYPNAGVIRLLFECARGHDAAVPKWEDGRMEALCAVYRTAPMVREIEKAVKNGDRFILAPVFKLKDVMYVDMEKIRRIDPELRMFVNINTVEDMEKLSEE